MRLTVCPFSVAVFAGSAAFLTWKLRQEAEEKKRKQNAGPWKVIFVLGGPGAGKGTQCQLLVDRLGDWAHLSAGDLLRAERKKGGPLGDLINAKIAAGQLVPSETTCKLIENAMKEVNAKTGITKFLIDGFPRSKGNADAWNATMPADEFNVKSVLFFECPEEVLVGRLMERGQTSGRTDDTIEVIRKRFHTFQAETAPIVDFYQAKGMVHKIASDKPVEDVYAEVVEFVKRL